MPRMLTPDELLDQGGATPLALRRGYLGGGTKSVLEKRIELVARRLEAVGGKPVESAGDDAAGSERDGGEPSGEPIED